MAEQRLSTLTFILLDEVLKERYNVLFVFQIIRVQIGTVKDLSQIR